MLRTAETTIAEWWLQNVYKMTRLMTMELSGPIGMCSLPFETLNQAFDRFNEIVGGFADSDRSPDIAPCETMTSSFDDFESTKAE